MLYSTPPINLFEPLPQQLEIIRDIRLNFDYSLGTHEVLLSGSVGSSKSLTLAHLVITHCLLYPGSRVGIGRLALPQLKATLCQKIREHLFDSGVDYKYHETTGNFQMPNDAEIKAVSWADGNLSKLGSMEFSAFAIEELTETPKSDAYDVVLQRTNRLPHVKEPWVVSATNPSGPSSWPYKKLILPKNKKIKVYYSNTFDNHYLDRNYIETLQERLDERMAQRMIYGKWVEIHTEQLYYSYSRENNYRDYSYAVNPDWPLRLTFDFNIGEKKPLSMVLTQYDPIKDEWHCFNQVIIEGQRTLDSLDEAHERGLLKHKHIKVHADATGRSKNTRSTQSDIDIIESFLSKLPGLRFEVEVPRANPGLRERHNLVNAYCRNANGRHRLFVYKDAPTVDEGFRLTKLRAGGKYLEDDSDYFQHCTTAVGYAICYQDSMAQRAGSSYRQVGTF